MKLLITQRHDASIASRIGRQSAHSRNGATLTEVLMSLMIMGIGVVSLATLFPISTQRILEATNLTNSTILRFNAEGLVDAFPSVVQNPDGDPATREAGSNYVVDPMGWYEHVAQRGLAMDAPELSGFEYNRPASITLPSLSRPTRHFGENPMAPVLFSSSDIARELTSLPDSTTLIAEGTPDLDGTNTAAYVQNGQGRITGLVLPATMDLSVVAFDPSQYQVTIFDKANDRSEVRRLSAVSGQTISWARNGDALPLPAHFTTTPSISPLLNVGLVRIEQPVAFYSWLLTVRKRASGPSNVDVVIFNKRDFSELSEQVYIGDLRRFNLGPDNAPGIAGFDDNGDGTDDDVNEIGYPLNPPVPAAQDLPNNQVLIDWTPSLYPAAPAGWPSTEPWPQPPPLRRGGYIFDSANGLWYRIRAILESPTATSALVSLETAISRDNSEDVEGNGSISDWVGEDINDNGTLDRGGLIIPRGVIAVFPLETKL